MLIAVILIKSVAVLVSDCLETLLATFCEGREVNFRPQCVDPVRYVCVELVSYIPSVPEHPKPILNKHKVLARVNCGLEELAFSLIFFEFVCL